MDPNALIAELRPAYSVNTVAKPTIIATTALRSKENRKNARSNTMVTTIYINSQQLQNGSS